MKIEWLFEGVTPVGTPDRAERAILGIILGDFLANSGHLCGRGSYFVTKEPPLEA